MFTDIVAGEYQQVEVKVEWAETEQTSPKTIELATTLYDET